MRVIIIIIVSHNRKYFFTRLNYKLLSVSFSKRQILEKMLVISSEIDVMHHPFILCPRFRILSILCNNYYMRSKYKLYVHTRL